MQRFVLRPSHPFNISPPRALRQLCTYAWGNADHGQLGLPSGQLCDEQYTFGRTSPLPQPVRALAQCDAPLAAVAASSSHTAFLLSDGRLLTCGRSSHGQLGYSSPAAETLKPTLVPNLTSVSHVACGASHTLVATHEGIVLSFGDDSAGQLGPSRDEDCRTTNPRIVSTLAQDGHRVVSVAAGDDFSVALTDDGRVLTWGAAQYGSLGHPPTPSLSPWAAFLLRRPPPPERYPRIVRALANRRIISIACGRRQVVAIDDTGSAFTWGLGRHYVLGTGDELDQHEPIRAFAHLPPLRKVAIGATHAILLTRDGVVFAVGESEKGCLGIGKASPLVAAVDAVRVDGASPAVDVAAGWQVSASVMKDGSVKTWGCAEAGALGIEGGVDVWEPQVVPGVVARKVVIASGGTSVFTMPKVCGAGS